MTTIQDLVSQLQCSANPQKAALLAKYFKTGKGEYGEGDVFIGVTVPEERAIAKKFTHLELEDVEKLLQSNIHEDRQTALMILALKFVKASPIERKKIYNLYLRNTKYINNWDLIDGSAPIIVGGYLFDHPKEKKILYKLVKSKSIWERRIAMLATYAFIKQNDFVDALAIAELLLTDRHDLMHKAVGWMLREIGKRDEKTLEDFLTKHTSHMPRTALRYAIERFSPQKRLRYLRRR
ncbi:DNA alkylation repair protein [Candidatus Gottesmanbacteria bacterium]|nr:DNA alkylation repair protein [Candidatus Gottesmanbacteria bacterium]